MKFSAFNKILLFGSIIGLLFLLSCGMYDHSSKETYDRIGSQNHNPSLEDNLDSKIQELCSQIANSIAIGAKGKVAVVDFVDLSGKSVNDLCRYIPNGFIDRLFRTGKFELLERKLLPKIMEELELNFSNLFDPKSQKRIGKLLGADAILSGTITDMVNSIKVNARLIETETGRILAVAEADIAKSDKVMRLTGTGIVVLPPPPTPPPLSSSPRTPSEPQKEKEQIARLPRGNLIVNGDFEEPWTVGWERIVADPSRGANHVRIVYSSDGEGDDDLCLHHTGESYMLLFQSIPVINCNLLFSACFKLGPFQRKGATSMIELEYGDKKGRYLGSTRLVNYHYSPFIYAKRRSPLNTGFKHHIKMGARWYRNYTINLREEIINNLPAIDPDRVKEIVINLYVGGNHKRCVSQLYADNLKLWYK